MIPVQAVRLLDEARRHKKAQQFHRREARRRMEELERFCRAHGIAFEEVIDGEAQKGQGHSPRIT